jgi:peptide/nickel transport system ATP-binding protein
MAALDEMVRTQRAPVSAAKADAPAEPVLRIDGLEVRYRVGRGDVVAVRDLTLQIGKAEILAIVGESGSGKTTAALAALNYLPRGGRIERGDVRLNGRSLLGLSMSERRKVYGRRIAHVAQDPSASLNPALKIGTQMTEGMVAHQSIAKRAALERARALLDEVHLVEPDRVLASYPHQLSGGMQQRVCIAMALACDPDLIVMDEPTTGLDAATESAIFELLRELRAQRGLSVLFISHNLAAVRSLADRVLVMYAGHAVEEGPTAQVFERPAHRYSSMLIRSLPTMRSLDGMPIEIPWQAKSAPPTGCPFRDRCDMATSRCEGDTPLKEVGTARRSACVLAQQLLAAPPLRALRTGLHETLPSSHDRTAETNDTLHVVGLTHRYRKPLGARASGRNTLADVALTIGRGDVLALIGESGSGKSTLARCIVGLERPLAGRMDFESYDLARPGRRPVAISRKLQIVFQNIAGSLHPGKLVREILGRPYRLYEDRNPSSDELRALVEGVGLKSDYLAKLAPMLSGGERQRVAIARATSSTPSLIVLDEAFSALDVSMKVKVMRLLQDHRSRAELSLLLITHDLPIVRFMADRVAVLYRGWLCEVGPRTIIEAPPMHPYTEMLMWSALALEGLRPHTLRLAQEAIPGRASSDGADVGCPFRARCPRYLGTPCDTQVPPLQESEAGHRIACHIPIARLRDLQSAEWSKVDDGVEAPVHER